MLEEFFFNKVEEKCHILYANESGPVKRKHWWGEIDCKLVELCLWIRKNNVQAEVQYNVQTLGTQMITPSDGSQEKAENVGTDTGGWDNVVLC